MLMEEIYQDIEEMRALRGQLLMEKRKLDCVYIK